MEYVRRFGDVGIVGSFFDVGVMVSLDCARRLRNSFP